MAIGYSDNFSVDADAAFTPGLVDASKSHARLRKKAMRYSVGASGVGYAVNDLINFGSFKSSDRLYDLRCTQTDSGTTGTVDMGFKKANLDHLGSVAIGAADAGDCFYDGAVFTTAQGRDDAFVDATDFADIDRGKRLWELINVYDGATTFTEDPMEDWDLVLEFLAVATQAFDILIEAEFVSFG